MQLQQYYNSSSVRMILSAFVAAFIAVFSISSSFKITAIDSINHQPPLVCITDSSVPLACQPTQTIRMPSATGAIVYKEKSAVIDASNTSQGYVMVQYTGKSSKVKLQIKGSNQIVYTYNLSRGGYQTFPLTSGNGNYQINVYEHVCNSQYALAFNKTIAVKLENSLLPFLYPNQYVNYSSNSEAVAKAAQLANEEENDTAIVQSVYNFVISNIVYDTQKAATVTSGYLPNVDCILRSGKGICFDYAALMTAMLRSQNIPTRLEIGYASGGIYHAWLSVHLKEQGWVNGLIYFDGKSWKLMDPTFASSTKNSDRIQQFIGNGENYSTKFVY